MESLHLFCLLHSRSDLGDLWLEQTSSENSSQQDYTDSENQQAFDGLSKLHLQDSLFPMFHEITSSLLQSFSLWKTGNAF